MSIVNPDTMVEINMVSRCIFNLCRVNRELYDNTLFKSLCSAITPKTPLQVSFNLPAYKANICLMLSSCNKIRYEQEKYKMTQAARWNLQHGVPENKAYEWTNYVVEDMLDAYIVSKVNMQNTLAEKRREQQQQESLKEYIKDDVKEQLDKTLKRSFEDVFKGFNPKITIKP